jgi:starch phosphorylase
LALQSIQTITVQPVLPDRIKRLKDLAYNLYWTWRPEIQALFAELNPRVWAASNHNPVRVLQECSQRDLERAAGNQDFVTQLEMALAEFDAYMHRADTWWKTHHANRKAMIAYFSMEFGFHESIQIYSGGLGVLAGDHLKSASDLDLPLVAVGMLFREGYFHQRLGADGWQGEYYDTLDPTRLPLTPAVGKDGEQVRVWVEISGRKICARIWQMQVGRITIYLVDANTPENPASDRMLTDRLYGTAQPGRSAHELRVAQELLLGVGGVRALRALGLEPSVFHMNEGHAAFLGLERARELIERGLTPPEAFEAVAAGAIFTTHTPVPAGNDAFAFELMDKKLGGYWYHAMKLSREDFLRLGWQDSRDGPTFSMTVLALKLSRYHNGVSELHGEVSRKMWNFVWPGAELPEVPITHVTNGIHTRSFLAPELLALYNQYFPAHWDDQLEDRGLWNAVDQIPDHDLWNARKALKRRLIQFARDRLRQQYLRDDRTAGRIAELEGVLSDDVLTIGFARRFATYKRATLLFRDLARLKRIISNAQRPVQFIFAGKAHPADNPGKEFIQRIYQMSQDPELKGRVVFLEDYDMNVARHLVQGCDIWLNNPRRPLEASGTSGEKASLNGCINFSVLDGWWREAYDGSNGWSIGEEREYADLELQDVADAESLYRTLEHEIAPLYYGTEGFGEGVSKGWLTCVRNAIKTVAPQFSMQRQVLDYVRDLYLPADAHSHASTQNDFAQARQLAAWKTRVIHDWHGVRLEAKLEHSGPIQPGQPLHVSARVYLDQLKPEDVRVEVVLSQQNGEMRHVLERTPLTMIERAEDGWVTYRGSATPTESGSFDVGVRAVPYRDALAHPLELGLVRWA